MFHKAYIKTDEHDIEYGGAKNIVEIESHVSSCGFMVRLYARTDARRGVWKAPARYVPVRRFRLFIGETL